MEMSRIKNDLQQPKNMIFISFSDEPVLSSENRVKSRLSPESALA